MPLVSIIVPVYNAENYLDECIHSLSVQLYKNIEIILVNDGSTDHSKEICEKWENADDRVILINQSNGGVSKARNTGIMHAKGQYVCFVDSDDYVGEDYCTTLLKYMNDNTDMVVTGLRQFGFHGDTLIRHRIASRFYDWQEILPIIIDDGTFSGFTLYSPCGVLYKMSIIKENGLIFRENVHYNEDGLFNTEYYLHCSKGIYIDYGISSYFYRMNEESATRKVDLFSHKYVKSMENVNAVLHSYVNEKNDKWINPQLNRRKVTIGFAQMRYASRLESGQEQIKKILHSKEFQDCLTDIEPGRLSKKKHLIYWLFRLKSTRILSICINGNYYTKRK